MVTRADLCSEFAFNNLDRAVTGINQGICDGFYAVNSSLMSGFNGVGNTMQGGFNATQVALMQGNNALQAQLADCCCTTKGAIRDAQFTNMQGQNAIQTQIAQCCCDTNNNITRGFADIGYRMATDTCALKTQMANDTRDIIDSQNAGTRAILDYLCQEKISDLQNENQALRLAASQAQQNSTIGAMISASEATILRRTGSECPQAAYIVQPPQPVSFPTNCCGQFNGGWNNGGCGCN